MTVMEAAAVRIERRGEIIAYCGLAFGALGWAAAFIAGKIVLAEMTPLGTGAWRFLLAAAVLAPFALRHVPTRAAATRVIVPFTVMLFCGGVLYQWLFMSALSRTSAANTALLIALNPAFTVLLAPLVGESLSRRRVIGLVIALAGAAVVITRGSAEVVLQLRFNSGDLLALCAACIWAVFNLASHLVLARISPSFVNLVVFAGGGATLFLLAGGEEPVQQLLSASFAALSGLVIMSVISSVLAGHAFLSGVRKLGVSRAVLFIYLVPVLTAALSVLLLGERFQLSQAVGGFAVLIGVYWGTRGGLRPEA